MTEAITYPTIRIRISHDKTAKGWRCNETTIDVTFHQPEPNANLLTELLQRAHTDGLIETHRRNQVEGFPA